MAWDVGERELQAAERMVARARKLNGGIVPDDWARSEPVIQRALAAHYGIKLRDALLVKMMRLPLLSRTRAGLLILWVARGIYPVPVATLQGLAASLGIGWRTVERAKRDLGLVAIRRRGRWYWRRP